MAGHDTGAGPPPRAKMRTAAERFHRGAVGVVRLDQCAGDDFRAASRNIIVRSAAVPATGILAFATDRAILAANPRIIRSYLGQ